MYSLMQAIIYTPSEFMEANDASGETANESSDEDYGLGFREEIRSFVLDANLPNIHCNRLLGILRRYTTENFPKDSRTFLETYRDKTHRTILNIQGGQFWYQGIRACVDFELSNIKPPTVDTVHINVSVDGLPLHDKGPAQFWPILIDVFEMPEAPVMTVGVFYGDSKPANIEEYLRPFVDDINEVQENGITIGGKPVQLRLRAIIADSPARAFIKGSKRTDNAFRAGSYGEHHRTRTPLLDIRNIDIIEDIIIADRLHLLDHGVTKRLLTGWCEGGLGAQHRWTPTQKDVISAKLLNIEFPSEMNGRMRSLNSLVEPHAPIRF
ncbi:hypothetical protein ZHAS_00006098 [Anopheles sinensis]|uniref:Uncharacterized protein n=1 Tax=Anopheles sinensis TaxID=74873 RepID=A0A084VL54_ANOSI|nr:hypothetical protein ZHAS_00006098 [Anopheles sinensis]